MVAFDTLVVAHKPFMGCIAPLCHGHKAWVGLVLGQHLTNLLAVGISIGHTAQVVGMRALNHAVFGHGNLFRFQVEQLLHPFAHQLLIGLAKACIGRGIEVAGARQEETVCDGMVLYQQNGHIGLGA